MLNLNLFRHSKRPFRGWLAAVVMVGTLVTPVVLTGCSQTDDSAKAKITMPNERVMTINGEEITKEAYQPLYDTYARMFNIENNPESLKNPMVQEQLKRMTLRKLILQNLMAMEAKNLGIEVTDKEVEKIHKETVEEAGGDEAFEVQLSRSHLDADSFKQTLKEQLLINKVLEQIAGDSLAVTEKEAKAFYDGHPDMFKFPEQYVASHILFSAVTPQMKKAVREENPDMDEETLAQEVEKQRQIIRQNAEKVFQEAKANPNQFAELAKTHSQDPGSKSQGGELGSMTEQTTEPTFWKALTETNPGQFHSKIVETPFGFHIIRVKKKIPAGTAAFEDVKAQVIKTLEQNKMQQALNDWMAQKEKDVTIEIAPKYQPQDPNAKPEAKEGKQAEAQTGEGKADPAATQ